MKISKIYLDMDGVVCDFEKKFKEKFGEDALKQRDKKLWTENWPNFIKNRQFEELEWFPGGLELLKFIRSYEVDVEMLTSSGGEMFHEEVAEQKRIWLKKNNIAYTPNVVPGRRHKAKYAKPDIILIDDTEDVISAFNKAGGIGILHKDAGETIEKLKVLLA
jgi:hypothetical protein